MRRAGRPKTRPAEAPRRLGVPGLYWALVVGVGGFGPACQRGTTNDEAAEIVSSRASAQPAAEATLEVGDVAPKVEFVLQDGSKRRLDSFKGQHVLVYFYPKDDTAGCTMQAEGIRDEFPRFQDQRVKVFGVSVQAADSHQAFIEKYSLPFDLVVDEDGGVARAFGVPLSGSGLASRQSFLIAPDGTIKRIWRKVSPAAHSADVLAALKE